MAAAESAAGRVTRDLRRRVLSGDLKPGTVLSQARIAAEYDVSRMPARDALQVLANEGLVDLGPATSVVRELTIAELQELYELREAVEPLLTRLAVPNVGRAEIAQMAALVDAMESDASPAEWLEANARFHAHVFTCADRPRMIELTQHLRRLTDRYLYLHVGAIENLEHLHAEHREILDAVRAGDAAAAAELTRLHLVASHDLILRHLLENELLAPLSPGSS